MWTWMCDPCTKPNIKKRKIWIAKCKRPQHFYTPVALTHLLRVVKWATRLAHALFKTSVCSTLISNRILYQRDMIWEEKYILSNRRVRAHMMVCIMHIYDYVSPLTHHTIWLTHSLTLIHIRSLAHSLSYSIHDIPQSVHLYKILELGHLDLLLHLAHQLLSLRLQERGRGIVIYLYRCIFLLNYSPSSLLFPKHGSSLFFQNINMYRERERERVVGKWEIPWNCSPYRIQASAGHEEGSHTCINDQYLFR